MYSGRKLKPDRLYSDHSVSNTIIFLAKIQFFFEENTRNDKMVERYSEPVSNTCSLCETH